MKYSLSEINYAVKPYVWSAVLDLLPVAIIQFQNMHGFDILIKVIS